MHNIFPSFVVSLCRNKPLGYFTHTMKKTTAFSLSSLLLLSGATYLAAKLADLDLTFYFHGDNDQHHYC